MSKGDPGGPDDGKADGGTPFLPDGVLREAGVLPLVLILEPREGEPSTDTPEKIQKCKT